MKVEGTKWYWSHGSQTLEGTRPTGPIGWMRLCVAVWFQTDDRFAGIPYRAYRLTSSHDFLRVSYGHQRFIVSYWRRWSIRLLTWLWCLSMSHLSKRTGYPSFPLPLFLLPSRFSSPISLPPRSPPLRSRPFKSSLGLGALKASPEGSGARLVASGGGGRGN